MTRVKKPPFAEFPNSSSATKSQGSSISSVLCQGHCESDENIIVCVAASPVGDKGNGSGNSGSPGVSYAVKLSIVSCFHAALAVWFLQLTPKNTHISHNDLSKPVPVSQTHLPEPVPINLSNVSLSLAKHVISTYAEDQNLIISPLSLRVLLGMVAAESNGPTQDQILGFLKSKSIDELNSLSSKLVTHVLADGELLGGPRLSTANGVWVDRSLRLKSTFEETVQNSYFAASNRVDFQTKADKVRKEVNRWAVRETNGLIKNLLPCDSVDCRTKLIFANAMYFKGLWEDTFDASFTERRKFFLLNGSSIQAPLMTSTARQYVCAFDGFKVLRLPYKHGQDERRFAMYFYLPDARDGLPALLVKVGSESGFIENHIPHHRVQVRRFLIPKFKIGSYFEATGVLKGLGLELPFRKGSLMEMVDSISEGKELYFDRIFQKVFIEVEEQGTKAAAVSAVCMRGRGCPPRKVMDFIDFVADHPFLFAIREDVSGEVLFIGQLLNPFGSR